MPRIIEEQIDTLNFRGAVDADGHILEAADLWETYCDPKYRSTAIRLKVDDQGMDYLEICGKPSRVSRGGAFASVGSMGQVTREKGEVNRCTNIMVMSFYSEQWMPSNGCNASI